MTKYNPHWNNMSEYIVNHIKADADCKDIANELVEKFSIELLVPSVKKDELFEYALGIVRTAYYAVKRAFYAK